MKNNYLYTELKKHLFVPVFMETIDLYMKYRKISPNDFVVYQTLMRFLCREKTSRHYGFTYITNSGIASTTGVSAPTVAKSIKNLDAVGLICIHENPYRQGKNQKYRYTIYEPLPKELFFEAFGINPDETKEVDENEYNQPGTLQAPAAEGEIPLPKAPVIEEEELVKEDKPRAKTKAKKANKKTYKEKGVDDWNYNDFISYFCHKYSEAYDTEYRIASTHFAKENARLKNCCVKYFNEDKMAFMFYIEELFKKRAQVQTQEYPTISIGTVCGFTNKFDLKKFAKMALLTRSERPVAENIQQEDEKFDNTTNNMIQYKEEDKNKIEIIMSEEDKKAFTELKSLFS